MTEEKKASVSFQNVAEWHVSGADVQVRVWTPREKEGPDASEHQRTVANVCEELNLRLSALSDPAVLCDTLLTQLRKATIVEVRTSQGGARAVRA